MRSDAYVKAKQRIAKPDREFLRVRDRALVKAMKLEQGQIWKKGEDYYRIVEWARLSIEYKLMKNPATKEGTLHHVTKKEFCRLLKGAELIQPQKSTGNEARALEESDL